MAEETNKASSQKTIYLDYNATTPLAPSVLKIIHETLRDAWGNPSSSHEAGKKAKDVIKCARTRVANMIGAEETDIIFTSGGTEANNTVLSSVVEYYNKFIANKNDPNVLRTQIPHIITSNIEHDSILLAVGHLVGSGVCEKTVVKASPSSGMVEVENIMQEIRPNTCIVSIMMANNETGVIQPVKDIVEEIRKLDEERAGKGYPKIFIHTDAAQTIGKIKVNVSELGVDYLTIVGHKVYGPRIGALFARSPSEETPLFPTLIGGNQERGYRPGTENTGMIAGLGEAAHLVLNNLQEYSSHMKKVRDYLEEKLLKVFGPNVHFNGKFASSERIPNTCNVSLLGPGLQGYRVLSRLKTTQASLGAACHSHQHYSPSRILLALGIPQEVACNALRISIGRETSLCDIDVVISDLQQSVASFKNNDDDSQIQS